MFNNLLYRLLLVSSLFLLSNSSPVFSADEGIDSAVDSVQMLAKININNASNEQLTTIKGLGNKKAQAIVDYRQKNGDFANLEDLLNVNGIGKSTLAKIEPFLTL